jgi:hypothetical protein
VSRVDVKITVIPTEVAAQFVAVRIVPPGTTATFTSGDTITNVLERPDTRYVSVNAGAPQKVLQFSVDIADVSGLTKQQFNNDIDTFSALFTANPDRLVKMQLAAASTGTSQSSPFVMIEQRFHVEFYERITLTQS